MPSVDPGGNPRSCSNSATDRPGRSGCPCGQERVRTAFAHARRVGTSERLQVVRGLPCGTGVVPVGTRGFGLWVFRAQRCGQDHQPSDDSRDAAAGHRRTLRVGIPVGNGGPQPRRLLAGRKRAVPQDDGCGRHRLFCDTQGRGVWRGSHPCPKVARSVWAGRLCRQKNRNAIQGHGAKSPGAVRDRA